MAVISPVNTSGVIKWANITAADTVLPFLIAPGEYTLEISGDWGTGGKAQMLYNVAATSATTPIQMGDFTVWEASANTSGVGLGPLAGGSIEPSITAGSGYNLTVTIAPNH